MAYTARLATTITPAVDRRLRMLALASSKPLNHVLDGLLAQVLPPADELAALLGGGRRRGVAEIRGPQHEDPDEAAA
jgi:hypothetical protein